MMGGGCRRNNKALLCVVVACFILLLEPVSSHSISVEALEASNKTDNYRRNMLQQDLKGSNPIEAIVNLAPCNKVNFDEISYKPLLDECKPPYPVVKCCGALRKLACPYTDAINDNKTVCALDLFWNIHKWYPAGWFIQHCKEGPHGLDCGYKKHDNISSLTTPDKTGSKKHDNIAPSPTHDKTGSNHAAAPSRASDKSGSKGTS